MKKRKTQDEYEGKYKDIIKQNEPKLNLKKTTVMVKTGKEYQKQDKLHPTKTAQQ